MILPTSALALDFQQRTPDARLKPWVQCLWSMGGNVAGSSFTEKLYPDAGASLTICLESARPVITLCLNRSTRMEHFASSAPRVGIRFKPAGIYCLLGLAPESVLENSQPLESIHKPAWTTDLIDVAERLYQLDGRHGMALMEDWLLRQLNSQPRVASRLPSLIDALNTLTFSPQQLGRQLGFSQRTLERSFKREVGTSPGQLISYARLRHARLALIHNEYSLADIALGCGYHDQAHFTHAFKKLALETPCAYRQRKLSQIYKA